MDEIQINGRMEINQMEQRNLRKLQDTAMALDRDLNWLEEILNIRLKCHLDGLGEGRSIYQCEPPDLSEDESYYGEFLNRYQIKKGERILLLMAIAPHLKPQIFDQFFTKNEGIDRGYTEFGGVKGIQHGGFLPTGETVAFVLTEGSLAKRIYLNDLFSDEHLFRKLNVLSLEEPPAHEPALSGRLVISHEFLSYLTTGKPFKPKFSVKFPAQEITSNLGWEDLILDEEVMEEVENILTWIRYREKDKEFQKRIMPGYRALFYGPPGTGKTLTATLLGQQTNRPVYRIDLSQMVSKYIGETEKNLSNLFDIAENRNWILFFDEADALFGQRTEMKDSKDRFANQETAYLLQRIESYQGIVILATNLKPNIDRAFMRRFQAILYFGMPNVDQRLRLWKNIQNGVTFDQEVDLGELSGQYELSGGAINNIVQNAWISSLKRKVAHIGKIDLLSAIRREYLKEGKTLTS